MGASGKGGFDEDKGVDYLQMLNEAYPDGVDGDNGIADGHKRVGKLNAQNFTAFGANAELYKSGSGAYGDDLVPTDSPSIKFNESASSKSGKERNRRAVAAATHHGEHLNQDNLVDENFDDAEYDEIYKAILGKDAIYASESDSYVRSLFLVRLHLQII